MKRLLMTTAMCAALATTALADAHTGVVMDYTASETDMFASELIGMRVYSTENDVDQMMPMTAGAETEWDDIGEINEIVISPDGQVAAVIVGVGGFLGMGEKDIAFDISQIKMMREGNDADDFFLVVQATGDMFKDGPAYNRSAAPEETDANTATVTDEATQSDTTTRPAARDRDMLLAPAVDREGYAPAERTDLTAEMLTGARVYGANDEDIGEIGELLLKDDGTIDRAVIDVGGFLGMGEKQVAVTLDELTFLREDGGDSVNVYIDATQEALEAQPAYEN